VDKSKEIIDNSDEAKIDFVENLTRVLSDAYLSSFSYRARAEFILEAFENGAFNTETHKVNLVFSEK
jgi:hypothetical protein